MKYRMSFRKEEGKRDGKTDRQIKAEIGVCGA